MLMQTILSTLALVASSLAISVNQPSGWTSTGPNTLTWSSVSTDKTSFAAILTNLDTQLLSIPITLVANQSTSAGTFTVTPSSFVASLDQEDTILKLFQLGTRVKLCIRLGHPRRHPDVDAHLGWFLRL
ncbi:hypothetical protein RQP46_002573 [Phenoliferia psychrophenolica]